MFDTARGIRVRSVLDDYFAPVILVLLAIAVLGGYLAVTAYTGTETQVQTSQITTWEDSGSFTHSATVVNGTAVYDEGDRLRGRSVYFRQVTPELDGTFLYAYTARESGNLTADTTLTLVLQSTGESETGNATEYWRLTSSLGEERTQLAPGDRLRVPFALNVSGAAQRLDAIDSQFGGTPGTKELFVVANVSLSGTRNGAPVDSTRTYRLPITPDGSVYQVGADGPVVDSNTRTVRETTPVEPGPLRAYGGPVLALVGVVLSLGCLGGRYTGVIDTSETEREWLAYRDARAEFDDWITRADISATDIPQSTVTAETLEGLVDIAIDTDNRVLSDSTGDGFFVFDEKRVYRYDPPSSPVQSTDGDVLADSVSAEDGSSTPVSDETQQPDGSPLEEAADDSES
jgi:hypothetical protein